MAEYLLMHKNIEVLSCTMIEEIGVLQDIQEIYQPEHIPVGIGKRTIDKKEFRRWWTSRAIPKDRENVSTLLRRLGKESAEELLLGNLGLSLTDHYWMKPKDMEATWEKVNFYHNPFSDKLGEDGLIPDSRHSTDYTPTFSVGGKLLKQWCIEEKERVLLKGGTLPYQQEPVNEVFAYEAYKALENGNCLPYTLRESIKQGLLSVCPCFTDESLEFVPAYYILQEKKKSNSISYLRHYQEVCREYGVYVEETMDTMLTMDFVLANTDRHMNNFGILRNSETLEWVCPAPVFDNGNSLWYQTATECIYNRTDLEIHSFYPTQRRQLEHVKRLPEIDFMKLTESAEKFDVILKENSKTISAQRRERLVSAFLERTEELKEVYARYAVKNQVVFPNRYEKKNRER